MKTLIKTTAALLPLVLAGLAPAAPVTYSAEKASASIPAYIQDFDGSGNPILVKRTFNTKAIINLSRGRDVKAAVPKNEVLVAAADANGLAGDDPNTPFKLVVIDANSADPTNLTVLARLLVPDTTVVPDVGDFATPKKFFRVGVGRTNILASGDPATFGIASGQLQYAGILKAKFTPNGPQPIISTGLSGKFSFYEGGVTKNGFILGGKFTASGKSLGTFTE